MLTLVMDRDGRLKSGQDTQWTITEYIYPICKCLEESCDRTHPDQCTECHTDILEEHIVCLDNGADSTHLECATILHHANTPHNDGSLYECEACMAKCYCADKYECVFHAMTLAKLNNELPEKVHLLTEIGMA